jgi:hypothetical protein
VLKRQRLHQKIPRSDKYFWQSRGYKILLSVNSPERLKTPVENLQKHGEIKNGGYCTESILW